jgi:hypothetical protein
MANIIMLWTYCHDYKMVDWKLTQSIGIQTGRSHIKMFVSNAVQTWLQEGIQYHKSVCPLNSLWSIYFGM